jgi:hypothetical protein
MVVFHCIADTAAASQSAIRFGKPNFRQSAIGVAPSNPFKPIRNPQLRFQSAGPESGSGLPPLSSHPVKPRQTRSNQSAIRNPQLESHPVAPLQPSSFIL